MSKNRETLEGKEADIITFAESDKGLNMRLYPVQKVILKMFYGLPLDGKEKSVKLPNETNTETIGEFTEQEFLQYLIDTGRTNVVSYSEGYHPAELLLNVGRRGLKSGTEGVICGYELYRLMHKKNPQMFYGLPNDEEISMCSVSCNREMALTFKDMVLNDCIPFSWFGGRVASKRVGSFTLKTDRDTDVRFVSDSYKSHSVYGCSNIVVVMDEAAFFKDGRSVYERLAPSLVRFTQKDADMKPVGDGDGRIVMASTPFRKKGVFYEKYVESFSEPDRTLMFDMYSTMLNPMIDSNFLKSVKKGNPQRFLNEFEAVFMD